MPPATYNNTAPSPQPQRTRSEWRSPEVQAARQQLTKAHARVTEVETQLGGAVEAMESHIDDFNEIWEQASEAEGAAVALLVTATREQRRVESQTNMQLASVQSSVDRLRGERDMVLARAEEKLEAMIHTLDECEANATETMRAAKMEEATRYRHFQKKLSERLRVERDGDKEEEVLQASVNALRSALVTAQTERARAATGDTGVADTVAQER